ncbi:hypothetical protein K474DRAFT_778270 [Panus rudis PR-1116 ss-1]|nr:hypothetical protein K474DRAFT_778270 [Panus rudis PR-1116 ss-1]
MHSHQLTLRARINQIDYTLPKTGPLDNSTLPRAPTIRVFGKSDLGEKVCVHVHQVYPYFFVDYTDHTSAEKVNRYIARLTQSLNYAIALSLKREPNSPNSRFIRAIVLVKGVHFYGFHSSYSPFLKIHIVDPAFVSRAVTILRSGTVMQTRFRVYESHLSYLLQFMCDFGLYGCGWIELGEVWQRGQSDNNDDDLSDETRDYASRTFKSSPYYRESRMPLELDVAAHQILNRHRLNARNAHHELKIPAPPQPSEPLVISVRELWEDERRRRATKGLSPTPSIPKDLSERSRGVGGDWVAEARYWEEIRKRIEREREKEAPTIQDVGWQTWVMTTFESIEALWEKEWKTWKPSSQRSRTNDHNTERSDDNPYAISSGESDQYIPQAEVKAEVDETILSSQDLAQSDTDAANWDAFEAEAPDVDESPEREGVPEYQSQPGTPLTKSNLDETPSSTPGSRSNPFQQAWFKLAGRTPAKLSFEDSTPRGHGTGKNPMTLRPILDPAPDNPFLDRSLLDLPSREPPSELTLQLLQAQKTVEEPVKQSTDAHVGLTRSSLEWKTVPSLHGTPSNSDEDQLRTPPSRRLELGNKRGFHYAASESPSDVDLPRKRQKLCTDTDDTPIEDVFPAVQLTVRRQPHTDSLSVATLSQQLSNMSHCYEYSVKPPSVADIVSSFDAHGLPSKIYQAPFYSRESDAPERPREFAGLVYNLKGGTGVFTLEEWIPEVHEQSLDDEMDFTPHFSHSHLHNANIWGWEYAGIPPSTKVVREWLSGEGATVPELNRTPKRPSQIEGPTQLNPYGLKGSLSTRHGESTREKGNMEVLSLEVFAPSRDQKLPDARQDAIVAVFWAFHNTDMQANDSNFSSICRSGVIVVRNKQLHERKLRNCNLDVVDDELGLLNRIVDVVHELDPDVLVGWDVQVGSWGYLDARGKTYDFDLQEELSRAPSRSSPGGFDQWGMRTMSTFKVAGRHVLNLWRIIRAEQSFTSYSFEHAAFQLLHRRTPWYHHSVLTSWYFSDTPEHVSRLLHYLSTRTLMVLEILDVSETITKNAEFARVFGIDFYSVLSRGSQFKVESFMFRIAKPESFVLLSPSKQDVGKQNAAECMPLIMEPLSAFYSSPLVVLDFQSLYPSIMIAYNYCYSTCVGRVVDFKGQNKFGVTNLRQPPGLLDKLKDHINVAPNGMIYVKPEVRKGLLGRMLTELLDTRVMVKQAMKSAKGDKALHRVLDARQLGLKFIANVTYGYTSATFSGRMPAVEIADSIVQSGRETLEKAIHLIDSTKKWGAKVVYGDTDSLFIYLKGRTKEQAFRIGNEIANTITAMNPAPIKLKFEKVYLPCVLMAKKRYVGFKYENPDDKEPAFDAKGIETVRRDGVPAQQKMVENCLKILFRTQDLSRVKDYCTESWSRILENKVSVQDFIFAKEVKMGTYSDKAPPPPGVAVAARRMVEDKGYEPQYGERLPYVIVRGEPLQRLVDRAVSPLEVLNDSHKRIDAAYYISRVLIPPLERIFNLLGADVRSWYDEMPRTLLAEQPDLTMLSPRKAKEYVEAADRFNIDEHFLNSRCLTCGSLTLAGKESAFSWIQNKLSRYAGVCGICRRKPQVTISRLLARIRDVETRMKNLQTICTSCASTPAAEAIHCESLDCPWLFARKKAEHKLEELESIEDFIEEVQDAARSDVSDGEDNEAIQTFWEDSDAEGGEDSEEGVMIHWDYEESDLDSDAENGEFREVYQADQADSS